ncbi:DoxX family protein [Polluticaenibacter yanchengensis]|uniref:DoxX family protein n=1 Tax=Polluticaenibacter yanchengensis TaxID=3014562 RepID=A0ABT4UHS3_9BACT|nr:DoxX family protein [Chitinophagaceae bacterium LY-5]
MKKVLFSTTTKPWAIDIASLLLRIVFGALMIPHGYGKLQNFDTYKAKFMSFMGLSQSISLGLAIFAEFFCAILLILGLFTRFSTIALIITFIVVVFKAHPMDFFGDGEMGTLYLGAYISILLLGPGKYSLDKLIK